MRTIDFVNPLRNAVQVLQKVLSFARRTKKQSAEDQFQEEILEFLKSQTPRNAQILATSQYFIGKYRCNYQLQRLMKRFLGEQNPTHAWIEITSIGYRVERYKNPCAHRFAIGTYTIAV